MNGEEKFWNNYFYVKKHSNVISLFYRFKIKITLKINNASIPFKSQIDDKIVFPHGLSGIFISEGAIIGSNCTIFQQVTIGSNTLPDSKGKGAPIIGDNCYIGAGAKIIGNVKVGDNVRIGANCVVVKDVPSNCTVVCAKSLIIKHDKKKNNEFIEYSKSIKEKC